MKNFVDCDRSIDSEHFLLDASVKELAIEARNLFNVLDCYSARIRALELELQKINANFPFRLKSVSENAGIG